jgi:branched-chain amino acid transport system permease protein
MTAGILLLTKRIEKAKLGFYFIAIREDQDAAAHVAVDIRKYKMIGMAISSFTTALGGTFYAQYYGYIDPDLTFGLQVSFDILLRTIVGGPGTVFGPIVGSLLLSPLSEVTRYGFRAFSGLHVMIFGSILIFVVICIPRGLVGLIQDVNSMIRRKGGKVRSEAT